ncbi:MAG: HAD family phosphatase [Ruminococcus sp.]|nr:HAD family phosphatase [Ruminococcus sp.]
MIKSVIFDLDGTLIDSMKIWYDVDRNFLKHMGVKNIPEGISEKMKTLTIEKAADYFINKFNFDVSPEYVINKIRELVRIEYEENIPLKPYAKELLEFLKENNIPCGIATATYRSLAESVLKRCGIYDYFRFILNDSDYPKGKKCPDIFFGAAERLNTLPCETLVVEDSLHALRTAAGAGFPTVAVYEETAFKEENEIKKTADMYFYSLKDIIGLFGE